MEIVVIFQLILKACSERLCLNGSKSAIINCNRYYGGCFYFDSNFDCNRYCGFVDAERLGLKIVEIVD